ncbi:MAG: hypothetical protein WAW13_02405 [Minisyncoccia bacterium]|jgi:hypothetical protein
MNPNDNNPNQQNKLDPSLGYLLSILRDIPILNSVPTDPPKYQISFALYENGGTRRFYVFFSGAWRYATLT